MPEWKNTSLKDKTSYSLHGLRDAFISEKAIRNETKGVLIVLILAVANGLPLTRIAAVFLLSLIPIIVELINTAFETVVDLMLGSTYREDVRMAKDMLSAAVFVSLFVSHSLSLLIIFFF